MGHLFVQKAIVTIRMALLRMFFVYSITKNNTPMIRFNDLKPGDLVLPNMKEKKWEGV